jgi:two-component system invasion response regulator UvrY
MAITLLIIDDHPLVRAGLRQTFAGSGIDVVGEAATVAEARRRARQPGVDVVLLDIGWLEGDETGSVDQGFELLREIRAARPGLPVLMYSIRDSAACVDRCRRLGANGYLVKGVDDRLLVAAVQAVHEGRAVWTDAVGGRGRCA